MLKYFAVWMCLVVSPILLPAAGATIKCSGKETLLRPILRENVVTQMSDCLMECTAITYQRQDHGNVRLKDSTQGNLGEYCWPSALQCNLGESFHQAFVVLPVNLSAVGHEHLEVSSTAPTVTGLQANTSPSTLSGQCGLQYEVTGHFGTENPGTKFCVKIVTLGDVPVGTLLRCPPYLVTFWQRSPNLSNQPAGQ